MDEVMTPAYLLRSYAWAVLRANDPTTWDASKYGGLTPIVPLGEEPELSEYSGPHIVYGYALDPTSGLHVRKSGSMTFAIYDQNFRRLTKTLNVLETAFGRQDESAQDINRYTEQLPGFVGMSFGWVSTAFAEGGSPEEAEGGRQSALLSISFEYYVDYDVITEVSPA